MTTRRGFTAFAATSILMPSSAFSQVAPELPPLPPDLIGAEGEPDFFSTFLDVRLGTADPGKSRREMAKAILDAAPKHCRPIDVAYYFRNLGQGNTEFRQEGRPYARGWPRIYNPIIIEFFSTTGLNPLDPSNDGDATPWCAAFVNYCIARAASKDGKIGASELERGTRSASSGMFRCFGSEVKDGEHAREGDIVVWALEGTVDGCKPGKGHVAFYVRPNTSSSLPLVVIGGNQSGDPLKDSDVRSDGMIEKAMPKRYLREKSPPRWNSFYGIRTAEFFR